MATKRFSPTELRLLELKLNGENLPRNNDGSVSKVVERMVYRLRDEGYLIKDWDNILQINPEKQAEWQPLLGYLPVPKDAQIVSAYYEPLPAQSPETLLDAPAFEQPTATPVMIPLYQVMSILEGIRAKAQANEDSYYEALDHALTEAIDEVELCLAFEPETPPTYTFEVEQPTNDDGLILPALDPNRETGYEEVNEEFTLMWEGLTSASAPLLAFLRLKLQTWFMQNKTDMVCSNIATDYDWPTVLVAFPDFKVAGSGKNYVDIESRESDTGLTIRITQDYHFDPDYRDERFTRLRNRS